MSAGEDVAQQARHAERSHWLDKVARAGLVAYALVYLVIAWLAVELALGHRQGSPSSAGALRELAQQPLGGVLIWAVAIGMLLLVVWQVLEGAVGRHDEQGVKRTLLRVGSFGRAVVYVVIGVSAIEVAVGAGSPGKGEQGWTAKLLNLPGGQLIVGAVALVIIGIGVGQIVYACMHRLAEQLTGEGRRGTSGTAYVAFGRTGYIARGVAFTLVGGLFGYAAVTHEAKKSGGLDQALVEVLDQPFGPALLCALGVGLACFGLFTLAQARHLSR